MPGKKRWTALLLSAALLTVSLPLTPQVSADVLEENPPLARQVAGEGMVLLKNDGALPLPHGRQVALFGAAMSGEYRPGGGGSGNVNTSYVVTPLQGLQNKALEGKISLYQPLIDACLSGADVTDSMMTQAANACDTAVIFLSRFAEEGKDRTATPGDYYLSDGEASLIARVKSKFQKTVVVLNTGIIMDTSWFAAPNPSHPVDAVLMAWQPGMEGGNAIADILCGDVNPSGKLADTLAADYTDYLSSQNFENAAFTLYEEDIFVGYRQFETFDPTYQRVNFPFGFGLSYTTFALDQQTMTQEGDALSVSVRVTNTGERAGKEVAQVYYAAPKGQLSKAGKNLAAFAKTRLLEPGESQTLTMTFDLTDMASYDDTGKIQKSAYIMEAGDYTVYVGNSIRDAGSRVAGVYTQQDVRVTRQLSQQMAPDMLVKRLTDEGSYEHILPTYQATPILITGTTHVAAQTVADTSGGLQTYDMGEGKTGICLAHMAGPGHFAAFDLEVAQAGDYQLTLQAANGSGPVTDPAIIYVDGVPQSAALTLPNTGPGETNGWYQFTALDPVTITLPAGRCQLKFVVRENKSFANLAGLSLTPAGQTIQPYEQQPVEETAEPLPEYPPAQKTEEGLVEWADVLEDPALMESFVAQMTVEELAQTMEGKLNGIPYGANAFGGGLYVKYGVTKGETADGPAGLNLTSRGTFWPCATLQACTFNTRLIEELGAALGKEARKSNVNYWLGPGMNIHRNPLCGRNFEYYSEDPLLTGKMAAAVVRGVQSQKVGAVLKHFACNNKETNRTAIDSRVSEKALREIYLKGFEIAIAQGGAWSVMTSYNQLNGRFTAERRDLLVNVLREEWGFDGLVMTDWGSHSNHVKEVAAGNDLKMPYGYGDPASLVAAVQNGQLTRAQLENACKNIFTALAKTTAYEDRVVIQPEGQSKIKAAVYDWIGGDVHGEATGDWDGGCDMGWMEPGSFMTYCVEVEQSGTYTITPRVASPDGNGSFRLLQDGEQAGLCQNTVRTNDWAQWADGTPFTAHLTKGRHMLKIEVITHGLNLNYLLFEAQALDKVTLSFDVNGGEADSCPEEQRLDVGQLAQRPEDPKRQDYRFAGWNTSPEGDGQAWDFASTPMPNGDLTLYAQWEPLRTLTGITVHPPVKTLFYEGEDVTLSGMVVVAQYDDQTTRAVEEYDISPYSTQTGIHTITVTYQGMTASFQIEIRPVGQTPETTVWVARQITVEQYLLSLMNREDYQVTQNGQPAAPGAPLATGMILCRREAGQTVQTAKIIVAGDLNGDGLINARDVSLGKEHILTSQPLAGIYAKALDLNNDGAANVLDVVGMKREIAGLND